MIKINTNIETKVSVDITTKGTDAETILELRIFSEGFFVGFRSTSDVLIIPPLNNIYWPEEEAVTISLKAYIGEYHLTIWREDVELTNVEPKLLVANEITVESTLIEVEDNEDEEYISVTLK